MFALVTSWQEIPENMFVLVICFCFRWKLLYQSACERIKLSIFLNSVNVNPTYDARHWNKCGLFLLGSLFWEEVSHPNAQRLFLILLIFILFKQHLSFLLEHVHQYTCISKFGKSSLVSQTSVYLVPPPGHKEVAQLCQDTQDCFPGLHPFGPPFDAC